MLTSLVLGHPKGVFAGRKGLSRLGGYETEGVCSCNNALIALTSTNTLCLGNGRVQTGCMVLNG